MDLPPMPTWAQIFELVHGHKPTPEELETSRQRALMVLDEIEIKISDSADIWKELNPEE